MADIQGVFFDLGGTLRICREAPEHQEAAKRRMAFLVGANDPDRLLEQIEARYADYRVWALGENREAGDEALWAEWLLPELPRPLIQAVCHEMTYQYRQVKGLRTMVEGGVTVIQTLKQRGYKLGIISNLIGEEEIPNWLRADGLASYFSAVVLSSVCHIRKPDPAIYRIACAEMGLPASACASVADNLNRDIAGAKAAGIGANILFMNPDKLATKTMTDQNRPDYIIHRFLDVLALAPLQGRSVHP